MELFYIGIILGIVIGMGIGYLVYGKTHKPKKPKDMNFGTITKAGDLAIKNNKNKGGLSC